jgi:hypothetical protein
LTMSKYSPGQILICNGVESTILSSEQVTFYEVETDGVVMRYSEEFVEDMFEVLV